MLARTSALNRAGTGMSVLGAAVRETGHGEKKAGLERRVLGEPT